MSPATLYAIKHVPTGKLMPARVFRTSSGGYTHWEPPDTKPGGYGGYNPLRPRFFLDKHAAAVAVTCWLKGPRCSTPGNPTSIGTRNSTVTP